MSPVFTAEAMNRPLFEEPTLAIERPDEWSEPFGFLFDPMFDRSKPTLSRQYLAAADLLVEAIRRQDYEDYKLIYPVLFLYRHAIEMILKAALGGDVAGHKLDKLTEVLIARCKEQHDAEVPIWITSRLKELAEIDPNSTAFRYAENWDAKAKRPVPLSAEVHVDLYHLQRSMTALHAALADVVGKLEGLPPS